MLSNKHGALTHKHWVVQFLTLKKGVKQYSKMSKVLGLFGIWICAFLGKVGLIRASVDALCRDGTSEISRDPRTKRLQARRESLARPSKHTNNF